MPVSARAGIVVTGTEVLTGRVQDRNGPWIADRLLELGVELAHITICGDRPADIEAQLRFMAEQGVDLIVTSGGLGPTADDMTVEVVARFCGRELVLDDEVERQDRQHPQKADGALRSESFDAVRAANRKQAMIPAGCAGARSGGHRARAWWSPASPTVIVLPGPPRELQPMWRRAIETPAAQQAIAGRTIYRQETIRMFGLPESGLAETLRDAETSVPGFESLEITTCLRRGEIEMVTRYEPDAADGLRAADAAAARPARPAAVLRRWLPGGRSGRPAAGRPPDRDGGILHRGAGGGAADRPARFVGLRGRRGGGLLQRGESASCSASTRR